MNKREKQLLKQFRSLQASDADSLLAFADFLVSRQPATPPEQLTVNKIERPAEETVIAAIKRLSTSYPMLDKDKMLNDTSSLMMKHVVQGKAANEVIDELEKLFEQHYAEIQEKTD